MLLYVFDVLLVGGLVCWVRLGVLPVFVYFSVRSFGWLLGVVVGLAFSACGCVFAGCWFYCCVLL